MESKPPMNSRDFGQGILSAAGRAIQSETYPCQSRPGSFERGVGRPFYRWSTLGLRQASYHRPQRHGCQRPRGIGEVETALRFSVG